MAVKNRPQVGWIDCHLCGSEATVHECAVGRGGTARRLYYRCAGCGCIQPRSDGGQAVMKRDMRPLEAGAKPVADVSPEPEPVPEPVIEPEGDYVPGAPATDLEPEPKRGPWAWLLNEDG